PSLLHPYRPPPYLPPFPTRRSSDLPYCHGKRTRRARSPAEAAGASTNRRPRWSTGVERERQRVCGNVGIVGRRRERDGEAHDAGDRKSTRLNSSHVSISYAVFCLKK